MDEYLGMAKDENNELLESNRNFPKTVLDGTDYAELLTYDTKTDFKTYTEQDLSAYANKYCIYWYRYEKDYRDGSACLVCGAACIGPEQDAG